MIVNLARRGALGDVLMTSTIIQNVRKKHPGCVIHYYTRMFEGASLIEGIDEIRDNDNWSKREPGVDYLLEGYPYSQGFPKVALTKHLTHYFADNCGVEPGQYSLKHTTQDKVQGRYITIHIKTGWSIYKEWEFEKWSQTLLRLRPYLGDTQVVQIGSATDPVLAGVDIDLRGKTTLAESVALIRDSVLHLGVDSFSNHIAGAYQKPAVIVFGSTSPIGFGYPSASNIYSHVSCSPCYKENPSMSRDPKGPCDHHSCMKQITVDEVVSAALNKLGVSMKTDKRPQTLCLGMIVKNESAIIKECLDSVSPLIDYWIICDTGSTDGTQELVRNYFKEKNIPGELIERPWINFGANRSEVFRYCEGKSDYVLVMDADDKIVGTFPDVPLTADMYYTPLVCEPLHYYRAQIFKNDLDWRYIGVLHEYPESPHAKAKVNLDGDYYIQARHIGSRSQDPRKYAKDAELLEQGLKAEPNNTRYMFYLGQSYMNAGNPEQAIIAYDKRIAAGGWAEEVFYSLLQKARCMISLDKDFGDIMETCLKAYHVRPSRAESLHELVRYCRLNGRNYTGYMIGKFAKQIPLPTKDILFVDPYVYKYQILDEFSICAYWIGRYQESFDICTQLLTTEIPDKKRIQTNLDFAKGKLS